MKPLTIAFLTLALALPALAKVDLVTLPKRESVQLTIYNAADLTLVREVRQLTLRKGVNRLQFSWANTLIDPTSLSMVPKAHAGDIDVDALVFPPRVKNLGLWTVRSRVSGKVPFEITYFTSGISWRAFYMGTLSPDEKEMRLQGYVRVTNNSGEDYENAQTRLVVGKVHILDRIAVLARRQQPYGDPRGRRRPRASRPVVQKAARVVRELEEMADNGGMLQRRKEVKKEGLSEYFLYTIEGTETIPHGWSKRLPSFEAEAVPVVNLYKYEQERYGPRCVRFLSFKNDTDHKLGDTPIPGGVLKVYRRTDAAGHLSWEGSSSFKYIPVDEDVELNLGAVTDVIVEPVLMRYHTDHYTYNRHGNIDGWDEIRDVRVRTRNTRAVAAKVEITRNFKHQYWDLERDGDIAAYKQVDLDTVRFTQQLEPRSQQEFTYTHTRHEGKRRQ